MYSISRYVILSATIIVLAACAKEPDKIAAADIGPNPYTGHNCRQLEVEKLKLTQGLESLSAQQKDAAAGDAFGVFLLGLPVSSMSGNDKETAIAIAKGRLNAVEQELLRKRCKP